MRTRLDSSYRFRVAQIRTIRRGISRIRTMAAAIPEGEQTRQRVYTGHIDIVRSAFLDAIKPSELTTLTAALERVADRLI
jgi:hypothetical protein